MTGRNPTIRFVLTLAVGACLAHGSVLFSNFSATPPGYVTNQQYGIAASITSFPPFSFQTRSYWGMGFTLTQDAILTGASLPLQVGGGEVRVSLMDSTTAGLPGNVIDSFLLSPTPNTAPVLFSGNFANAPGVTAGQSYWLVTFIESTTGNAGWSTANPFFSGLGSGPVASRTVNPFMIPGGWSARSTEQAAFELDGQLLSAVPEPTAFGLTGIGLALAMLFYRGKGGNGNWRPLTRRMTG